MGTFAENPAADARPSGLRLRWAPCASWKGGLIGGGRRIEVLGGRCTPPHEVAVVFVVGLGTGTGIRCGLER
jgi:hypothetical protein